MKMIWRHLFWAVIPAVVVCEAIGGERLDALDVLSKGYPRAFFFRTTEGWARSGRKPFAQWERSFQRLNGIMGKVFNEEIPHTAERNIDFFTRFKKRHPNQAVLLHYNGNTRDPRDDTTTFFAGHWLYYNGCVLVEDLPAEAGESVVRVEDPRLFRTHMGRYGDRNEDVVLCAITAAGRPDFSMAEQVELLAVDAGAKTLRIRRGAFGTRPLAWKKNRAYAAAHVTGGPWGKNSNLLWKYNYSLSCPRDAAGKTCSDVLIDEWAQRFGPGGAIEAFDGVEFDVLRNDTFRRLSPRGVDSDGDGQADAGFCAGRNVFGLGVYAFCQRLRERIGPDRLILADGGSPHNQRAFGALNGIESEGWPNIYDWEFNEWSSGINRHRFWNTRSASPTIHYVNHKFNDRGTGGLHPVPFGRSRLVLAACQMMDAAVTYALAPAPEADEQFGIYDELRMGTAKRINWLGKPLGPTVQLALDSEDLLGGQGVAVSDAFLKRLRSTNAKFVRVDQSGPIIQVNSVQSDASHMWFSFSEVRVPGPDVVLRLRVRAEPFPGYPAAIARTLAVTCEPAGWLVGDTPFAVGVQDEDGHDRPLDKDATGAVVQAHSSWRIGQQDHQAYLVHPPYKDKCVVGAVYWEQEVTLPPEAVLRFATGIRPARSRSDGVTFGVDIRDGANIATVFSEHQKELAWVDRTADLSKWSGQTIRLRFLAGPGPAGNTVADQACWGDVQVVSRSQVSAFSRSPKPVTQATWADGEWFEATFYFRDVDPGPVRFDFDIEATTAVELSSITLHAHPDVMLRAFEHGLVLANPSLRPFSFDLTSLVPEARFRRLTGSSNQDRQTNDGSAVNGPVIVPSRDGLFLMKTGS